MHQGRKLVVAALMAVLLLAARAPIAAPADEMAKDAVLRRLDVAAVNFHSTSADFEFDAVETEPIPDKDVQKGTVYYERKGNSFQMAAHIHELNGKIASKVVSYASGVVNLYEKLTNQVTRFSKASQYEGYLMLGFGASGKELEQKWEIKYLGPEVIDGVKTEKLEMVAKDSTVRKNIPKVTIWLDTERAVSLKQVFEEGPGQYRVCFYFNFKTNQPLPADAFTLKTDKQTVYINR
jgi:outer membrane lipoprotein-sorting protein